MALLGRCDRERLIFHLTGEGTDPHLTGSILIDPPSSKNLNDIL